MAVNFGAGMSAVTDDRVQKISEIVCEQLEITLDAVSPTSLFKEDLHADSLSVIEIFSAVEEEFNIVFDQSKHELMTNVRGVYEVASETAGW
jgi:acyl carrier protein